MLTYEKNIYVNWFGHKVVIIENVKWNEVLKAHKKMYLLIILNPNLNQIKVNCLLSYHKKTVYNRPLNLNHIRTQNNKNN